MERVLVASTTRWRANNGVPGVVAGVVRGSELVWSYADGLADVASARPISVDHLFRIGSITKTFVATAILQLRDEKALELDDPLSQHLPHARAISNPYGPIQAVTLRDMLQHTAGFPREVPVRAPDGPIALVDDDFLGALNGMELVRPPRTACQYSNVAYRLLGYVVEAVAGQAFAQYCETHICGPLGMSETTTDPTGDLMGRVVHGHWARDDSGVTRPHRPMEPERTGGEGALYSTVSDMGRWVQQQLRTSPSMSRGIGQVLDGSSLSEMHRPLVLADPLWSVAWGLGWSTVRRPEGCRFHGHNGSFAGHQAYVGFCSDHEHGAVVLTNGHTTALPAVELCSALLNATQADPVRTERVADGGSSRTWSEYIGTYVWAQVAATVRIAPERGGLACSDSQSTVLLSPWPPEPDTFRLVSGPQQGEFVRFFRGSDGEVLAVNVAGYTYYRKIEGPGR